MQKHRKTNRGDRPVSRNANRRVSSVAADYCEGIIDSFTRDDDQAVEYLRKQYLSKFCSEDLVPADERRDAAVQKWISTERRNAETNLRIKSLDPGYNVLPRVALTSFLQFARRLTARILGPLSDELVLGSFSGGASTSRSRARGHPALKFVGEADVTSEAWPYVDLIHRQAPLLRQYGFLTTDVSEVKGAKLFTVPKKTEIDRCACKEPDVNMYLQKAAGDHISRRLRRFGIDLNDQSVNRRLARTGSITGDLATLDLSSASDTMTIELVRLLLPEEWFLYLDDIRSHRVEVNGWYIRTEMFSSMGNGFTFELESLLFYVLMRAVSYFEGVSGVISVYGDDIIIPTGMYDLATFVLGLFGFTTNDSKSFHTGSFRESCGGHYDNGVDVTPFYLRRRVSRLTDVIRLANQLRRWALADPARQYVNPSAFQTWNKLASFVPKSLWGGRDLESDTQLVAPIPPNRQLVRRSEEKELPMMGSYLLWHNSSWNRSIDPDEGFEPVDTRPVCYLRRAKRGAPYVDDYFYEEVV